MNQDKTSTILLIEPADRGYKISVMSLWEQLGSLQGSVQACQAASVW